LPGPRLQDPAHPHGLWPCGLGFVGHSILATVTNGNTMAMNPEVLPKTPEPPRKKQALRKAIPGRPSMAGPREWEIRTIVKRARQSIG